MKVVFVLGILTLAASLLPPSLSSVRLPTPAGRIEGGFEVFRAALETNWLRADGGLQSRAVPLPESFFGFSIEWGGTPQWTGNFKNFTSLPGFMPLLQQLNNGNGPMVLRMGGISQDEWDTVFPDDAWQALAELHHSSGLRFIIGVNLKLDRPDLAVAQAKAALANLPETSIIAFEVGNEPSAYPGQTPEHYLASFAKFRKALLPVTGRHSLAGPSWDKLWMPCELLADFLAQEEDNLAVATLHSYYGDARDPKYTIADILSQNASAGAAAFVLQRAAACAAVEVPLRIGELNSLYAHGKAGVSDTFAAALWGIDIMFELAVAGAAGVNFHGATGRAYDAVEPVLDKETGEVVAKAKMLYYGMWFFQQATSGGVSLLPVQSHGGRGNVKVWAGMSNHGDELRVVFLNKDLSLGSGKFQFELPAALHGGDAKLYVLKAPGWDATHGATFAGRTAKEGHDRSEIDEKDQVVVMQDAQGVQVYEFDIHPSMAALMIISVGMEGSANAVA